MELEFNLRGLSGWMLCDGVFVVPVMGEDAFRDASKFVAESNYCDNYEEYILEQDGWTLGLASSGEQVVQVEIDQNNLYNVICNSRSGNFVYLLYLCAAKCVGLRIDDPDILDKLSSGQAGKADLGAMNG